VKRKNKPKYPYARPKSMEQIFNLILNEEEWSPRAILVSTLKTLNMAPSKESEAIGCLKFLGIINEDGEPTDVFTRLRGDFVPTLRERVLYGYDQLFDQIPRGMINQTTLVNFFKEQGYVEDTAEYQGSLFVYLCKKSRIDLPNAEESFSRARLRSRQQE